MPATDIEEEQDASLTSGIGTRQYATSERIAAVFKGVATMTREFERCPRGSRVTERLMYFAMACGAIVAVTVLLVRFGH